MKEETFINIMELVAIAMFLVFVIVGTTSIAQVNNRLDEQNVILKELVIACQNQADAIQEQNKIFNAEEK